MSAFLKRKKNPSTVIEMLSNAYKKMYIVQLVQIKWNLKLNLEIS